MANDERIKNLCNHVEADEIKALEAERDEIKRQLERTEALLTELESGDDV